MNCSCEEKCPNCECQQKAPTKPRASPPAKVFAFTLGKPTFILISTTEGK